MAIVGFYRDWWKIKRSVSLVWKWLSFIVSKTLSNSGTEFPCPAWKLHLLSRTTARELFSFTVYAFSFEFMPLLKYAISSDGSLKCWNYWTCSAILLPSPVTIFHLSIPLVGNFVNSTSPGTIIPQYRKIFLVQ